MNVIEIRAKLEVLDPTAGPVVDKIWISPRLDSLAGKTIGVIWNGRPAGNRILYQVMDTLKKKDGVRETLFREKPFLGNIAPLELLEEMATRCDAVITGVGD
jgi:hypothetical protein